MDKFQSILLTDNIKDSLLPLLNRDLTSLTMSSGTNFPQDINSDMVGRLVNRTDLKHIYVLDQVEPIVWRLVLDYSNPIPNASEISENYQPLNSNLTALSKVSSKENEIPYFVSNGEMSTIPLNSFTKDLLETQNETDVREMLGLGNLATKDLIDGSTDILNSSVTENKLSFTPIKSGEGFTTGDIKETYNSDFEEGWILYSGSIGNSDSGATHANDSYKNLFIMLWSLSGVTVSPNKGATATADWDAGKKITLPSLTSITSSQQWKIKI